MDKTVSKYMGRIGANGGKAAKGDKKRRSPEFYQKLSRKGVEARKRKADSVTEGESK